MNYIEIEPVTGVMTKVVRQYTMVYSMECGAEISSTACAMPFPSMKAYSGRQWPVFNVTEEITIDHEAFIESVRYITDAHNNIWTWSYVLSIIAFTSLILACIFQSIYWMNEPIEVPYDERLIKLEMLVKKNDDLYAINAENGHFVF